MKKIIAILFVGLSIVGCTDLNLSPKDGTTADFTFIDVPSYKQYMAKVYGAYMLTGQDGPAGDADLSLVNDEGFTSYMRAYWKAQQITTDETHLTWTDGGIQDMNEHKWDSQNQFVRVLYYRLALIISLANDFLAQSTDAKLAEKGFTAGDIATIKGFEAEVRYLRAMAYWHAIDLFRNVPLVTSITTDPPSQATPQQTFDFIESELSAVEPVLPDPMANEYGRVDKAAVWMLKAKLYLNSTVYTGVDKYAECVTEVNKVIGEAYTLEGDYYANFRADNNQSNELIFNFTSDGASSQTWGGTTFLVHSMILDPMVPGDYGVDAGWNGPRATSVFVGKFGDITTTQDGRSSFYTNGRNLVIDEPSNNGSFGGYGVPKFSNKYTDGSDGVNQTFVDTDWPVFRLADAYLMFAECAVRGAAGADLATATSYINMLRERAYGDASGNITQADLNNTFILDERSREMYWEGHRRMDLIRFDQFTTNGVWPWKGGDANGIVTDAKYNIFPIPATDLSSNPKLVQNTGY